MTANQFIIPNVYHSPATFDGYAEVTGGVALQFGAKLLGFVAENTNAATRWIQVFDGYAQPTTGTVPLLSIKATTGSQVSFGEVVIRAIQMMKGIVIASSTTGPTYTPGSSDMFLTAFWIDG